MRRNNLTSDQYEHKCVGLIQHTKCVSVTESGLRFDSWPRGSNACTMFMKCFTWFKIFEAGYKMRFCGCIMHTSIRLYESGRGLIFDGRKMVRMYWRNVYVSTCHQPYSNQYQNVLKKRLRVHVSPTLFKSRPVNFQDQV